MARRRRRLATAVTAAVAVGSLALLGATGSHAATGVERVVIGTSVQGRPIVALHRTAGDGADRVLVVGSMHGDEDAGKRVVARLREAGLPDGTDLWLVRTMNPDGDVVDRRTNARGVDLNRNFPRFWVLADRGTSTYSGPRAASEPETHALMRFVRDHGVRTTVIFHQPLHGVDSYRAKSMRLVRDLADRSGLPVRSFDCGGGCHGTFTDWHNDRTTGRAVTVELGRSPTSGTVDRVATAVLRAAR